MRRKFLLAIVQSLTIRLLPVHIGVHDRKPKTRLPLETITERHVYRTTSLSTVDKIPRDSFRVSSIINRILNAYLTERCDGSRDTISSTPRSPGHENYNSLNGELRSNTSIVVEPRISPEIETSLLNEQVKSKPSFILNKFISQSVHR